MNKRTIFTFIVSVGLLLAACSTEPGKVQDNNDQVLDVLATTTFIGEAVQRIGGDHINLVLLLPPGANPHAFEPTPQDLIKINKADIIFINGVGLEEFMDDVLENSGSSAEIVTVSDGMELRSFSDRLNDDSAEDHDDHDETDADPHIWLDPNNIIHWTYNIETYLSKHDPDHQVEFQVNADAYRAELASLDEWVREQVALIPEENRELVTDHTAFGYFADRYGFTQVGAVIPAPTTEAEPSGKELATLVDNIRAYDVKAVFVGFDFDPTLSERVAEDTGIQLVPLYFGSLTGSDGPAPTYDAFTRYNVNAIVDALK